MHIRLIVWRQRGAATGAGLGVQIAHMIGIGAQLARNAGPALAPRLRRIGTLAFWPLDGGSEELSGVLGGMFSCASSAATRATSAAFCPVRMRICPACASTSASSSDLSSWPSESASIPSLNQPDPPKSTCPGQSAALYPDVQKTALKLLVALNSHGVAIATRHSLKS